MANINKTQISKFGFGHTNRPYRFQSAQGEPLRSWVRTLTLQTPAGSMICRSLAQSRPRPDLIASPGRERQYKEGVKKERKGATTARNVSWIPARGLSAGERASEPATAPRACRPTSGHLLPGWRMRATPATLCPQGPCTPPFRTLGNARAQATPPPPPRPAPAAILLFSYIPPPTPTPAATWHAATEEKAAP